MPTTSAFHPHSHNHDHCIATAMTQAENICRRKGVRFTPIRRRVLELIWANPRPVSAYDLLQQLRREKRNAEPPTVYRALDFLLAHQLVHKIVSLNAFVGCPHPQRRHDAQFLICSDCRQVAEIDDADLQRTIESAAHRGGLEAARPTIEITGLCPRCRQ